MLSKAQGFRPYQAPGGRYGFKRSLKLGERLACRRTVRPVDPALYHMFSLLVKSLFGNDLTSRIMYTILLSSLRARN